MVKQLPTKNKIGATRTPGSSDNNRSMRSRSNSLNDTDLSSTSNTPLKEKSFAKVVKDSLLDVSSASSTSSNQKKTVKKKACPCNGTSDGKDWLLVCCDCAQHWHSSCCNMKGARKLKQADIDGMLKQWQCPWCFKVPFQKPSKHSSSLNESILLERTMSCSVIQQIVESVRETVKESIPVLDTSDLSKKLEILSNEVESFKSGLTSMTVPHLHDNHSAAPANQQLPHQLPPVQVRLSCPEKPYERYSEDFLTNEEISSLIDLLGYSKDSGDFINERGHSVRQYGLPYAYNGSRSDNTVDEIPSELTSIINRLSTELNLAEPPNSVLINYFPATADGTHIPCESFLAMHSDDEPSITADSKIITISIGSSRKIVFEPKHSHEKNLEELEVKNNSIYVMSRSSQNWFRHSVPQPAPSSDVDERYSITFRCLKKQFRRSIVVIGDSNSKDINFGAGTGKVGESYPGKRVQATRVKDIDPNQCVGYSNVFIMCGTNDLRCDNIKGEPDIHTVVEKLRQKLTEINKLCPDSKVFVIPVMPSRIHRMNNNIRKYNELVDHMLFSCFPDVWYQGIYSFLDDQSLLSAKLTRTGDKIHLGPRGVAKLVSYIKACVFKREKYELHKLGNLRQESTQRVGSTEPT